MSIYAIDRAQPAMPAGEEEKARAFYNRVLGIAEVPKPPHLAVRSGVWFEQGKLKIHLGVEKDFRAAKKAHPALLVNGLDEFVKKMHRRGLRGCFR